MSTLFQFTTAHFHNLIIFLVGIYSIALDFSIISIPVPGLFVSNWHYFLMGNLLSQVFRGLPGSNFVFFAWIIIETISQIFIALKIYLLAGIVLCFIIVGNLRFGFWEKIFNCSFLQYLGMISYPLYLVHPEIGWKVISLGKHIFHNSMSCSLAVMLFFSGVLSSLFFAHLFHLLIEKPSLRLNLKLQCLIQ